MESSAGILKRRLSILQNFNLMLHMTTHVLIPPLQNLENSDPAAYSALVVMLCGMIFSPFPPVSPLSVASSAKVLAADNKGVMYVVLVTVGPRRRRQCKDIAGTFGELYELEEGKWEFEVTRRIGLYRTGIEPHILLGAGGKKRLGHRSSNPR